MNQPRRKNVRRERITVKLPAELVEFLKTQIGKYGHVTSISDSVEMCIIIAMPTLLPNTNGDLKIED